MEAAMPTDQRQDQTLSLAGTRVLLIEDEYFIADEVRRILVSAGAEVVGPMATVAHANAAVDKGDFDCAVLDLNLRDESAIEVGDRLLAGGHAFVIATGYGSPAVPDRLKVVPRLEKPYDPMTLARLIGELGCACSK